MKRKKIQLNASTIEQVRQQDKGTVELLNEYLHDEIEDDELTVKTEQVNNKEIQLKIETKQEEEKSKVFIEGISLNEIQEEAIKLFFENSFSVSISRVEEYCKLKGAFKNQLIESINENCYETLDDVLIEEDDDNYVMNENYFKKISSL